MLKSLLPILMLVLVFSSCKKDDACSDCGGGPQDGYLYKTVTQDDISTLGTLGIQLEECIQYKIDFSEEIDLETVLVVDDCCCDLYEF